MERFSTKQLCYFEHLEECLVHVIQASNENSENFLFEFFKIVSEHSSYNAILLARKVAYPHVSKIIAEIKQPQI